jgi:acetyl/propionyl-CoA carboxylase alpha subunit
MISKFATYGRDRSEAIGRMRRALAEYQIGGIKTTLPFFREIMEDKEFIAGKLDTGFISRFNERKKVVEPDQITGDLAMIAAALAYSLHKAAPSAASSNGQSRWAQIGREIALGNRL